MMKYTHKLTASDNMLAGTQHHYINAADDDTAAEKALKYCQRNDAAPLTLIRRADNYDLLKGEASND